MILSLRKYSYRFAEQVLNSKLVLKDEIESILTDTNLDIASLSCPKFNELLKEKFVEKGWESQPSVFDESKDPSAKRIF